MYTYICHNMHKVDLLVLYITQHGEAITRCNKSFSEINIKFNSFSCFTFIEITRKKYREECHDYLHT